MPFSSHVVDPVPHRYTLSLQALAHVLLLASQNPFYVVRFAETAYTAGDTPLALKTFLRVIDMDESDFPEGNAAKRAWWGVKLVRLKHTPYNYLLLNRNSRYATPMHGGYAVDLNTPFVLSQFTVGFADSSTVCRTSEIARRTVHRTTSRVLPHDVG